MEAVLLCPELHRDAGSPENCSARFASGLPARRQRGGIGERPGDKLDHSRGNAGVLALVQAIFIFFMSVIQARKRERFPIEELD